MVDAKQASVEQIAAKDAEINLLKDQLKQLEENKKHNLVSVEDTEFVIGPLEDENKDLNDENTDLKKQITTLNDENTDLEKQIMILEENLKKRDKTISSIMQLYQNLEADHEKLKIILKQRQ